MNILFTCGGTAGHINPAAALARLFQVRDPECQVLFVGADGGMESRLVPKEGYPIETVTITNFRRSLTPSAIGHNLKTVWNMGRSRRQSNAILDKFRPDLVVGTGGYASYPVVRAAAARGIPTAIHDSNAIPGLTTKALSKVADRVLVGFEESRKHYEHPEKVVVTGTPVRQEFFQYTRRDAKAKLGLDDGRPLLLSVWGSLGAEAMNAQMVGFIAQECREGAPFYHIHGAGRDYQTLLNVLKKERIDLKAHPSIDVREYIYDMPTVMAAADLVLCRAGASTISELTAIAKPSILVPSPNVVADHQTKNAKVLADAGGAVLLPERDSSAQTLYELSAGLLRNRERRDAMGAALRGIAVADASERIYQILMELTAQHPSPSP